MHQALGFYNSVAFIKKHFEIFSWWTLFIAFIVQNKTRKIKKCLQNELSFVMISFKCTSTFRTSMKQQSHFHWCCPCLEYPPNSSKAFLQ